MIGRFEASVTATGTKTRSTSTCKGSLWAYTVARPFADPWLPMDARSPASLAEGRCPSPRDWLGDEFAKEATMHNRRNWKRMARLVVKFMLSEGLATRKNA